MQRFWASAVATAWMAPMAAAVIAVALYEANQDSPSSVLGRAIVAALVLWLLVALGYSPMTGPIQANRRSYSLLRARIDGLLKRQEKVCLHSKAQSCKEAKEGIHTADSMLKEPGLQWVSQRGYIAVWEKVHRAEEALMEAEDRDALLEDVEHDVLRLNDSEIPLRDDLEELLDSAKDFLLNGKPKAGKDKTDDDTWIDSIQTARKALKEVRYNINVFRDNLWNGLVGLRTQTLATLVLTELAGFALLGLAILNTVDPKALGAGALYFLVGAAFGLFNRLYSEAQAEHAVDDYGLAMARILTLPVYAGLAGIGGVVLTSLTSGQPSGANLGAVFEVQSHPLLLIAAAAFGLAPALLIEGVTKQGREFVAAIKSTEAGQKKHN